MGAPLVFLVPDRDADPAPGGARWYDDQGREWSPLQFNILMRCPRCRREAFELWIRHLDPEQRRCAYCVEFRAVLPRNPDETRPPAVSP